MKSATDIPHTFTQTTRDPNTGKLETDEKEFDNHEARKHVATPPAHSPEEEKQP